MKQMLPEPEFKDALVDAVPHLRAFARSLCGDREQADDLTQEALVKAWNARDKFAPGTNFRAWTFTILRNHFYSEIRKSSRQTRLTDEHAAVALVDAPAQTDSMDVVDLRRALQLLPAEQREALILVGAGGFAYDEAARICECAVGTIKSRVARARRHLAEIWDQGDLPPRGADEDAERAVDRTLDEVQQLAAGNGPQR